MMANTLPQTNFAILQVYDEQLVRLGVLAEKYFADNPNTCLIKIRQYGELLAQDPNDEPASVLLERIRAERAAGEEQKARKAGTV